MIHQKKITTLTSEKGECSVLLPFNITWRRYCAPPSFPNDGGIAYQNPRATQKGRWQGVIVPCCLLQHHAK